MEGKKTKKYRINEFYDGGLIQLNNLPVPSKRIGYKRNDQGILVAKVPIGVPEFEGAIKEIFSIPVEKWPLNGRLLVGIGIGMPKKDYLIKDVDNMAKTILDAFRGIAYDDDKQIVSLFVSKTILSDWLVMMVLKTLGDISKSWFLEPMLIGISEIKIQKE